MVDINQWRASIGGWSCRCTSISWSVSNNKAKTNPTITDSVTILAGPATLSLVLVLVLLLVLSGDIELNLGPPGLKPEVSDVFRFLQPHSSRWDDIGRALNVDPNIRQGISREGTIQHKLEDVIRHWIESRWFEVSWDKLIEVLQGQELQFMKTAEEIESCLLNDVQMKTKYNWERAKQQSVFMEYSSSSGQSTEIISQSYQSSESQLPRDLRKYKSDPLPQTSLQHTTIGPSLHHSTSDTTDYHSKNHFDGANDDDVRLYRQTLVGLYKRRAPAYSKNPSPSIEKFINLLILPKNKKSSKKAAMKHKMKGDTSKLMEGKTPISMNDICAINDEDKFPCLVLIQGDPGVGKTTLAWELCKKWAKEEILKDWIIVKIVQLRDKVVRDAEDLQSLIDPYNELAGVNNYIRGKNGSGILLIFDGFDELSDNQRKPSSIFMRLLRGDLISDVSIIVTTRPSAFDSIPESFRNNLHQHIEVIGFTEKCINKYIEAKFEEDTEILEDFRAYISSHHFVFTFMYVPLHCALITNLYEDYWHEEREFAPKTLTQLYTCFIHSLIQRNTEQKIQKDIKELPLHLLKEFNDLARIAAEGIVSKTYVFDDIPKDSFGMLQKTSDFKNSISCSFLHLTLQEYLAAYYWSTQPRAAIDDLFVKRGTLSIDYCGEIRKPMALSHLPALHFYSGLTGIVRTPLEDLVGHYRKQLPSVYDFFCLLFESQDCSVVSSVFNEDWEKVTIEYIKEAYVTGYCIARASGSVKWDLKIKESPFIESMVHGIEHAMLPKDDSLKNINTTSTIQKIEILNGKKNWDIHQFMYWIGKIGRHVKNLKLTFNSELVNFKPQPASDGNYSLDLLHFQYKKLNEFTADAKAIKFTEALLSILTPLTTLKMVSLIGVFNRRIITNIFLEKNHGNLCLVTDNDANGEKRFTFTPSIIPENCPAKGLVPYVVIQRFIKHVSFGLLEHGYKLFHCGCCGSFSSLRSLFNPVYSKVFQSHNVYIKRWSNNLQDCIKVILLDGTFEFLFEEHFCIYFHNVETKEWKSLKVKENTENQFAAMILVNEDNVQFLTEHILSNSDIKIQLANIFTQEEHLQQTILQNIPSQIVEALLPVKFEKPFQFSIIMADNLPYSSNTIKNKGFIEKYSANVLEWRVSYIRLHELLEQMNNYLPFEVISFSVECSEPQFNMEMVVEKLLSQSTLKAFKIMYWKPSSTLAEPIATRLKKSEGLEVVEFIHVSSSDCIELLYEGLANHASLKTLIIVGCKVSFEKLLKVVYSIKNLTHMVIHNCDFEVYQYQSLMHAMAQDEKKNIFICEKKEILQEIYEGLKEHTIRCNIMLADSKNNSSWAKPYLRQRKVTTIQKATLQEFQKAVNSLKI